MFKTSLFYQTAKVSSRPGRGPSFIQTRATEGDEGAHESPSGLQLAQPNGSPRKGQKAEIVRTKVARQEQRDAGPK